jgi:long-chain acyl-CoA synthetase
MVNLIPSPAIYVLTQSLGSLDAKTLIPARVALSVPLIHTYTHPTVTGPVLATHPLDLQFFPARAGDAFADVVPVGPASVNVEVKLLGVDDAVVEGGGDPAGELYVRGPPVGRVVGVKGVKEEEEGGDEMGWVGTGDQAQVHANGSFKVQRVRS